MLEVCAERAALSGVGANLDLRLGGDEAAVARLDWLAAEPDTARDGERMREIAGERRAAADKVAALTDEWERIATELEA
jgi:hypothetical protein